MTTLVNDGPDTLYLDVKRNNGESYTTTISVGGSWSIPSDVSAVLIK